MAGHGRNASGTTEQPEASTLSSRVAYQNPWLRLREDQVRWRDGRTGLYGVVELTDFAVVVPWDAGCVTLVEQYRYPVRARLWELPMGTRPSGGGGEPADLAAAELREETGLVAGRLTYAGPLQLAPGFCSQLGHVFVASQLTQGEHAREMGEQGMVTRAFPLGAVEAMIHDGTICDTITLAALSLARMKGLLG